MKALKKTPVQLKRPAIPHSMPLLLSGSQTCLELLESSKDPEQPIDFTESMNESKLIKNNGQLKI